jgi:hypothetical protein
LNMNLSFGILVAGMTYQQSWAQIQIQFTHISC